MLGYNVGSFSFASPMLTGRNMRIFLTGATGYIGSAVLEAATRAGHDVTALVRDTRKARKVQKAGATPVVGDLAEPDAWREAAAGHDAYVHTAFENSVRGVDVDRTAVESLIALAREQGPGTPVICTSDTWVLGSTRVPASEETPVNPPVHSAWRPDRERFLLAAAGIRPVVVRPGIVYGGARGLVGDLFRDGTNGLVRIVGEGRNHWVCVYCRDLAELYVRLMAHPDASGVFHASDEADETVMDIVEALSRSTTHRPDIRFVRLEEARAKMGAYADALALDQLVRGPRARALGWTPALKSVAGNVQRLLEEWRSAR
jgi:nucleoside-diphosphate-sugar epimerase